MIVHYPLDPLLAHVPDSMVTASNGATWPRGRRITALAQLIGRARRTVHRWQREGIPEFSADHAAVALGKHPAEIWGEAWWDVALDDWSAVESQWWQWEAQGWADHVDASELEERWAA